MRGPKKLAEEFSRESGKNKENGEPPHINTTNHELINLPETIFDIILIVYFYRRN